MKYLIIIFLYCSSCLVLASEKTDSLWTVWQDETIPVIDRVNAINDIAGEFYRSKSDSAKVLAEMGLEAAEKAGYLNGVYRSKFLIGQSLYYKGERDEAMMVLQNLLESIQIKSKEDLKIQADVEYFLGIRYMLRGLYSKALELCFKSLDHYTKLQDKDGLISSHVGLNYIYKNQGLYEQSRAHLSVADSIALAIQDTTAHYVVIGNLAVVLSLEGKFDESDSLHYLVMENDRKIGNISGIALTYNNIGWNYEIREDYEKAREYYTKSLELSTQINYDFYINIARSNLSRMALKLGDPQEAVRQALPVYEKAISMSDIRRQEESLNVLHKAYASIGNFSQAYSHLLKYIEIRDSIRNDNNVQEATTKELQYHFEKEQLTDSINFAKQQQISHLQLKQQESELQNEAQFRYFLFVGLGLAVLFGIFIFNRFKVTSKQKVIIEDAHHALEEKNQEIMDSITYAKRIQNAILPPSKLVKEYLNNSFILYKPKDVVAGDFYWMEPYGDKVLFAAADCTGHGVPGAMVSVICNNGLNRSVREFGLTDPGEILTKTRELVIKEFEKSEDEVKDGMDIALVSLELRASAESENETPHSHSASHSILKYAGAHNPLWVIRKGSSEVEEYKADKQPIGVHDNPVPFATNTVQLNSGDCFYIFSDGFADQFGGEKGKKYKSTNFKQLLLSIQDQPIEKQRELIDKAFEMWRGNLEQIDDLCIIGVQV
ncbi:MAG: tetratricopeptide repeat protein [Crocinitomicaceae bacterium]|nr:tetratricopeptide repeat protein [Crocinitomicaceae bacterium]